MAEEASEGGGLSGKDGVLDSSSVLGAEVFTSICPYMVASGALVFHQAPELSTLCPSPDTFTKMSTELASSVWKQKGLKREIQNLN